MRTKLNLSDLRIRLAIRLAVAPRHILKRLWSPQTRPHEGDAARQEVVDFITQGWESLEIEATTTHAIPSGHVPPAPDDE